MFSVTCLLWYAMFHDLVYMQVVGALSPVFVCSGSLLVFSTKKENSVILCEAPCIWQGTQTDRLGCMSAISSTWLTELFSLVPPSWLSFPYIPLQW